MKELLFDERVKQKPARFSTRRPSTCEKDADVVVVGPHFDDSQLVGNILLDIQHLSEKSTQTIVAAPAHVVAIRARLLDLEPNLQLVLDNCEPRRLHLYIEESTSDELSETQSLYNYTKTLQLPASVTSLTVTHLADNVLNENHHTHVRMMILLNLISQIDWDKCAVTVNLHLNKLHRDDHVRLDLVRDLPVHFNVEAHDELDDELGLESIYAKHPYLAA